MLNLSKGLKIFLGAIFFSSYNRCLRFCPLFLPSPPGFIGYVIDVRDLQLLNFAMWLFNIPSFSETATE